MGDQFDATTYGRSFSDVYDDWYPGDAASAAAVDRLVTILGDGGADVLELGVGTGRLALPLAERGHSVTGLDASEEMLAQLSDKQVGADRPVGAAVADVGRRGDWPDGPFDLVLAAFNMVFNVVEPEAQRSLFSSAFDVLRPGGCFVVECSVPAPMDATERLLELRSVELDRVVLIATETDPVTSVVTGQHIELRDGDPVRLRPWRIRAVTPEQLDAWATSAGLGLDDRTADWQGGAFGPDSAGHVSVYRRPPT